VILYNTDRSSATQHWYLYEAEPGQSKGIPSGWSVVDFSDPTRLYGIKKLQIVSILLNAGAEGMQGTYVVQSTKAQPTNVQNLLALLSVVGGGNVAAAQVSARFDGYGCKTIDTGFSTSSIQIGSNIQGSDNSTKLITGSQTITNEAKAWWDVSFALPIKKASAVQYNSTANTVTASQINKQSLFATGDIYPLRTDLKAAYSWSPAIFFGVSLASQPLHSMLMGVSMHFSMASIYAGALLLKQQQLKGLSPGSPGSSDQVTAATSYAYEPSFSVGLKLSIRSTASQIKSATTK
jgi:hypothetical protein